MTSLVRVTQRGSFDKTESYLRSFDTDRIASILEKYGEKGVLALAEATPQDTGLTSESWYYEVVERFGYCSLRFRNRNQINNTPVVIFIQYGHATRNGGWVEGRNFVMPAIEPIFEQIMSEVEKEVIK